MVDSLKLAIAECAAALARDGTLGSVSSDNNDAAAGRLPVGLLVSLGAPPA